MICETITLPTGETAIVCSRGPRRPKCQCGAPSTKLCDFKLDEPIIRGGQQTRRKRTCDRPLCDGCAVSVGPDVDHCPDHPKVVPVQGAFEL